MPSVGSELVVCRLRLRPDQDSFQAIEATFAAHEALLAWLADTVPPSQNADLVALHRLVYEPARSRFGLPSQMVVLALRDFARRRRGDPVEGIALDEKLFSIRNIAMASLATVRGRISIPCRVEGYERGWSDRAGARLLRQNDQFEIRVATDAPILNGDNTMATESVIGRIGRLIAGMAHDAVGQAERANPRAVLEGALREMDKATEEVRLDLGRATAERHRVAARRAELAAELKDLEAQIAVALQQDRDDLAEKGVGRQIDIEAQIGVLDRLLADIDDSVAQFNATLDAVRASRREAQVRLVDLDRPAPAAAQQGQTAGRPAPADRVERAEAAIARATGVPAGPAPADRSIDELRQLARDAEIRERLNRLKGAAGS